MTRRPFTLLCLFVFALAHAEGERVTYTCNDGSRFAAEFMSGAGRPQATLFLAGREITLPLVPAASGAVSDSLPGAPMTRSARPASLPFRLSRSTAKKR